MPTCVNCRKGGFWEQDRCPHCGFFLRSGTWTMQTDLLHPAAGGWGFAPATYQSRWFRIAALLCPVWLPFIIALVSRLLPGGIWFLLLLFSFIPGVWVIANLASWGKLVRVLVSLIYVVFAVATSILLIAGIGLIWQ